MGRSSPAIARNLLDDRLTDTFSEVLLSMKKARGSRALPFLLAISVPPLLVSPALFLAPAVLMVANGGTVQAAALHKKTKASGTHKRTTAAATRSRGTARKKVQARHVTKASKKAPLLERHVPAVRGGLPNVQALGALVLDENGHELYARSPDQERPIASISKLAATLAVMDRGLELEGLSTISKSDIEVARGGARSRLLEGMTLSNRDLLHAALMGSDNRAIPALGRAVKLSPTQLAAVMSAKAKELGLTRTRFHDPTGLSINNVSTPRETIVLLQAVMHHPVLGPITQRVEYDAHPVGRPPIRYVNTYRPAVRANVQVMGGKTGYNDDARYCLVLAAKIDGHTCYMSFLGNEGKLTRFGDVARVADWVVSRKPKPEAPTILAATTPAPTKSTTPVRGRPTVANASTPNRPPNATAAASATATARATTATPAVETTLVSKAPPAANDDGLKSADAISSLAGPAGTSVPAPAEATVPIESVAR